MKLLKALVVKISEAYDRLFKTWTGFVIFFLAYFLVLRFLPDKLSNIIVGLFLAFILIAILGRGVRTKGPKN